MLKLIGILVLSSQLNVAVETDSGFTEASFPNTAAGAEALVGYAEQTVGEPEDGVHVVLGWLDDAADDEHIIRKLDSIGVKHAFASPADVRAAIAENQLDEASPVAVALAFKRRMAFLWRPRIR